MEMGVGRERYDRQVSSQIPPAIAYGKKRVSERERKRQVEGGSESTNVRGRGPRL